MRKIKKQVVLITTLLFIFCGFSFGQGIRYTGSYTPATAIVWNGISNKEISGLSFTNIGQTNIELWNCSNITIRNCKFSKSAFHAITAENAHNLTITDCVFDSVADGILVNRNAANPYNGGKSSGIKITHNYFKNTIGGMPGHHSIQLSCVDGGGGNQINFNSFENIHLQSHQDDMISLFKCYGSVNDSIQIISNWFRGSDYNIENLTGGCITFGDNGGSYIHIKNNILVNSGGIGNAGANHTVVEYNVVLKEQWNANPANNQDGFIMYNFTTGSDSTECYQNTWQYNRGLYLDSKGVDHTYRALTYPKDNCSYPIGLNTNIVDWTLNASILPANIAKAKGVVTDTDPTSSSINYKIFPNPVFGQSIIITSENPGNEKISIYNLSGQTVVEKLINTTRTEINTSNLVTGIYVITISKDNTILEVRKIRV